MPERPQRLSPGERVLLIDHKRRRYLVTLVEGGEFHSHAGVLTHDEIIGSEEGAPFSTSKGGSYTVLRPTLADFVLKMPRGAQVIYPKDLAPILMLADISPGVRVLESGVGFRGAVDGDAACRGVDRRVRAAGGVRDPRAAKRRVVPRGGGDGALRGRAARLLRGHRRGRSRPGGPRPARAVAGGAPRGRAARPRRDHRGLHAVDHPGRAVPHGAAGTARFRFAETIEVLHRSWHIEGEAVRPDHRMVAHTGFLTHARWLG